jgi:N-acetyl-gamma-glutamyl-phosphate reductase
MINICITGATGYTGVDLVRLLSSHSGVNISSVVSQNYVGEKFSNVYPSLKGIFDMECSALNIDEICKEADIIINALPHGVSKDIIPDFINKGKRVIDLSADFRYKNVQTYEKIYGVTHKAPDLSVNAIYGLPELYRDKIRNASLVANPGCYPTCSILGIAPLLKNKLINTKGIIIDALSGVSGAGRKLDLSTQFCETTTNFKAYAVAKHRHTTEIEQEYSLLSNEDIMVSFTPHLIPVNRGMLCTIYTDLNKATDTNELTEIYKDFYKDEYFVRVCDDSKLPEIKNVAGSNFIDIAVVVDKRLNKAIALSAQDNLGKGSSSQAVQNLNIMCGFDEKTGLGGPSLYL